MMNQQTANNFEIQTTRPFGRLVAREIQQDEIQKLAAAANTMSTSHMVGEGADEMCDPLGC